MNRQTSENPCHKTDFLAFLIDLWEGGSHSVQLCTLKSQAMQHLPAFLPITFKFQGKDILKNEPNEHLEKGLNSTNMLI